MVYTNNKQSYSKVHMLSMSLPYYYYYDSKTLELINKHNLVLELT